MDGVVDSIMDINMCFSTNIYYSLPNECVKRIIIYSGILGIPLVVWGLGEFWLWLPAILLQFWACGMAESGFL